MLENQQKISIALVDDHELFRAGIKLILSKRNDMEIVIEAPNGEEFLKQLDVLQPDIVLLDIAMPVLNGFETAKLALKKYPDIKIIILTMQNDEAYYLKMIELGVKGFILKKSGVNELLSAIQEVYQGNDYFSSELLTKLVLSLNNQNINNELNLNENEKQVLYYLCNGLVSKEIADKLYLSEKSIERYRSKLLQKTNTRNSAHLVMHALKNRLIEL